MGEAHESALKEAETDATKRALVTFGNPFGLALYDKDKTGLRRESQRRSKPREPGKSWILYGPNGGTLSVHREPLALCRALQQAICSTNVETELHELWACNRSVLDQLRVAEPKLVTPKGNHYGDVLARWYERQSARLVGQIVREASSAENPASVSYSEQSPSGPIDKSELPIGVPRRVRDEAHLKFVGSQPCLICGRIPAQAHHLRFAQPRSMGSKVSDEWTVPLCFLHHRALHDVGSEETWWSDKGIDAKATAERLWNESRTVSTISAQ